VNLPRLALAYLRAQGLGTVLNIVLMALGVAAITVVLLFTHQVEDRFLRDAKGIDLVVGAKGSPLQLVLSSVYHLDLVQYATPLAAAMLPRQIASVPSLMGASPAFESARLMQLVGVGTDALQAFAWIMIVAAGLSIFVALLSALRQRRYDLAIMRTLGASRGKVTGVVLMEGLLLGVAGAVAGIVLGHAMTAVLGTWLRDARQIDVTGAVFLPAELGLFALAVVVGVVGALVPALSAYRTEVAETLARG